LLDTGSTVIIFQSLFLVDMGLKLKLQNMPVFKQIWSWKIVHILKLWIINWVICKYMAKKSIFIVCKRLYLGCPGRRSSMSRFSNLCIRFLFYPCDIDLRFGWFASRWINGLNPIRFKLLLEDWRRAFYWRALQLKYDWHKSIFSTCWKWE